MKAALLTLCVAVSGCLINVQDPTKVEVCKERSVLVVSGTSVWIDCPYKLDAQVVAGGVLIICPCPPSEKPKQ